jgi:DtxR family transcriptional regulator, Mn-dependent transcriptional regulator
MISLTEENYLKALFNTANELGEVTVNDLAKRLDVKMPTITGMMKKLADKQLVHYESYKPIRLTEAGNREAGLIIRKHRLTEMYLVEKMGFGWEEVHDIAEQIEHIQSHGFFDKMDELLAHPKIDPHGSPIPDRNGNMEWIAYSKLSDCTAGQTVKLSAVINTTPEFLKYLNTRELKLGLKITIESVEPFDKSMVVAYANRTAETLTAMVCERLLVDGL